MNNKLKSLALIAGISLYSSSYAQITTLNPTIISLNPRLGLSVQTTNSIAAAIANSKKDNTTITKTTEEIKTSSKNTDDSKDKEIKKELDKKITEEDLLKDTKTDNKVNDTVAIKQTVVEKTTGQVKLTNNIIRTNDIRLWNNSSLIEKQEEGQKNLQENLKNK